MVSAKRGEGVEEVAVLSGEEVCDGAKTGLWCGVSFVRCLFFGARRSGDARCDGCVTASPVRSFFFSFLFVGWERPEISGEMTCVEIRGET